MDQQQLKMLKQLMAQEFTVIDMHLYLDTHPNDQRALADYNVFLQQLNTLKEAYERQYGPLTAQSGGGWAWIEEPWPWDIDYSSEETR